MKIVVEKKALIVYAHPYNKSFAYAELKQVEKALQSCKKEYEIIDLHKDKFDPVFHVDELAQYSKGTTNNPQIIKYIKMLNEADELIFIYPLWWGTQPAILKGFFDKVFLIKHTWVPIKLPMKTGGIIKGKMTWIKKATVFTTGVAPKFLVKKFLGYPSKKQMVRATLKGLGIKNIKWIYSGRIADRSNANRKKILNKVYKIISK